MKIFVTGATGYIGGSIAHYLANCGMEVFGLVRGQERVEVLKQHKVKPIVGTLEERELLAYYAQACDAVIHAANSDHRESVDAFLEALQGSGKTFIHTSGSSVIGDDARGEYCSENIFADDTPFIPIEIRKERAQLNQAVRIAGITNGMRTMVVVPPMIYGKGLGLQLQSDQLPKLIQKSKEKRAGVYLGKGLNRWSTLHIEDLVLLFRLALEKGPSAAIFFAENGEIDFITLAGVISYALGFGQKTISWSIEEAIDELGDWARFALGSNSRIRAVNARRLLGWKPKGESILNWLADSSL